MLDNDLSALRLVKNGENHPGAFNKRLAQNDLVAVEDQEHTIGRVARAFFGRYGISKEDGAWFDQVLFPAKFNNSFISSFSSHVKIAPMKAQKGIVRQD